MAKKSADDGRPGPYSLHGRYFGLFNISFDDIAMIHLGLKTGIGQTFADLLGDHYRAVLPAGAAKGYCQIAFSFSSLIAHAIDESAGNPVA